MGLLAIIVAVIVIVAIIVIAIVSALSKNSEASEAAPGAELKHNHAPGAENDGCAACKAAAKPVKAKVPEKCIVKFRPVSGWTGQFGFDWVRDGLTSLSGDKDYKTVVAENKFATLRDGFYKPFTSPWKKEKDGANYIYPSPWLTLFPPDQCIGNNKKSEAKLKLYIEVAGKEPEILRLDFNKEYFKLDKKEVTPKSVGKNGTMDLTITCLKEFDTDQEIRVFPYKKGEDSIAGKLMVLKNSKPNRFKCNVVFVNVSTKIDGTPKVGAATPGEKLIFERQFYQPLITVNIKDVSLNLKDDAELTSTYTMNDGGSKKIISNPAGKPKLHEYLITKFTNDEGIKKLKIDFSDYFKIFFFLDDGGSKKSDGSFKAAGGQASDIPSPIKCVTVYNLHKDTAPVHELLHALGLWHTFEPVAHINNKFKYLPDKITDNIMDYSDVRQSTWKWQWEIMQANPSIKKEE